MPQANIWPSSIRFEFVAEIERRVQSVRGAHCALVGHEVAAPGCDHGEFCSVVGKLSRRTTRRGWPPITFWRRMSHPSPEEGIVIRKYFQVRAARLVTELSPPS